MTDNGVHFRVWAPDRGTVDVMIEGDAPRVVHLEPEPGGYFSGLSTGLRAGAHYKYRLDGGDAFPDPASRFQPQGPNSASQVVDPRAFSWSDNNWPGVTMDSQVIHEMHIGTFTKEGTWQSARRQLRSLRETGITLLEVMPVAEFPGRFGWGYDGVQLYSPTHLYGSPEDFRQFVDSAHSLGLGVILDVVYNHLGPDGNYLPQFSHHYFSNERETDWGPSINFDGENSKPVREFCVANAGYWIDEFHLDGLRLDATQDIHDSSKDHVLAAITRTARQKAAPRTIVVIAENEAQQSRLVRSPEQGGYGLDGLWNDDFHHSAMVALTGRAEAYYTDYRGTPQEFISSAKYGFLYQGQYYKWQEERRGTPSLDLNPACFVAFIQNHDQIANSAHGKRLHFLTGPGQFRAMTALLLLAPATPMLFQGQEFGASTPFFYFADHKQELAEMVARGRVEFLSQFPSLATPEVSALVPNPADAATFEHCKLDHSEREKHAHIYALHRDLIELRREDAVIRSRRRGGVDGAVLTAEAFVFRFFGDDDDRLLVVNLGIDLDLNPAPEPLLAPPAGTRWNTLWSSEHPNYGGSGTPPLDTTQNWKIPGCAAVVLKPESSDE